jgi:LL-diaminopimelate aminotransferase
MVQRNPNLAKLKNNYLFQRINSFITSPDMINLGIGDVTEPLHSIIADEMQKYASQLSTREGFSGYGPAQGLHKLRKNIVEKLYNNIIDVDEVFISDGAKCDIARMQMLFGSGKKVAVQDPSYPVYVDDNIIAGNEITYLKCTPENDFFAPIPKDIDLIYFCSPNNPTGAVATREQLTQVVQVAQRNNSIIIFDTAYAAFIQNEDLPRSIYEIEGAREVAIEVSSFSKFAGFTGIRLGWSIVPKELKFNDGTLVHQDWLRVVSTAFNGASNISQHGGIACLENLDEVMKQVHFYMENAQILKRGLEEIGLKVYGGDNAPYLWVEFQGLDSWKVFEHIIKKSRVVTIPGSGFGPSGEGFIRISAFNHRDKIVEAISSEVIAPWRNILQPSS